MKNRISGLLDAGKASEQVATREQPAFQFPEEYEFPVQIRWLINGDMPDVQMIECQGFLNPWTQNDFLSALRERNIIGMVAKHGHKIVGFMVYELQKKELRLLNFAVDPKHQRKQVGTQMIARLADKLSEQRRKKIVAEIRESNLPAQLFFSAVNFRATTVIHGWFEDTNEDAYLMEFEI